MVRLDAKAVGVSSMLYHVLASKVCRQRTPLERGMLITSIDVDVGNRVLGRVNKGKNDHNVHNLLTEYEVGIIEERCVPMLLDLFEELEMPVTFALRGQLFDVGSPIIERLLGSRVRFDIGGHGYYHRQFGRISRNQAEQELIMMDECMSKFAITPRSFVFPLNSVGHLDLLASHGYVCYRDRGGFLRDGTYLRKTGELWDVHPSLFLNRNADLVLLRMILDLCIIRKHPLHVWFHPKDFGYDSKTMRSTLGRVLHPFFRYAKNKNLDGLLDLETMLSAVQKVSH
jgi:peptidoglycan/xylan/chitin deacetylase (PgdA/CDA1 family)